MAKPRLDKSKSLTAHALSVRHILNLILIKQNVMNHFAVRARRSMHLVIVSLVLSMKLNLKMESLVHYLNVLMSITRSSKMVHVRHVQIICPQVQKTDIHA
jgi:hypothetical protein